MRARAKRPRTGGGESGRGALFSRGPGTLSIPPSIHTQAREKLARSLCAALRTASQPPSGVVLLRAGESSCRNDTDREELFRQESYFSYLYGVKEPDWIGLLEFGEGASPRTTLLIPRLPAEYAVWMGEITPPEDFRERYRVDDVAFVDQLEEKLRGALGRCSHVGACVHTMSGMNSDSGVDLAAVLGVEGLLPKGVPHSTDALYDVLAECRVLKCAAELQVMRYVSHISSLAHVAVMREVRVGMLEYQLEARFLHHIYVHGGARHAAYTSICACGPNSAVLHVRHACTLGVPPWCCVVYMYVCVTRCRHFLAVRPRWGAQRRAAEGGADGAPRHGSGVPHVLQRHHVQLPSERQVQRRPEAHFRSGSAGTA